MPATETVTVTTVDELFLCETCDQLDCQCEDEPGVVDTEERLETELAAMLGSDEAVMRVCTFEEKGVLTRDRGLYVTLRDGTRFYLTIQEDRR